MSTPVLSFVLRHVKETEEEENVSDQPMCPYSWKTKTKKFIPDLCSTCNYPYPESGVHGRRGGARSVCHALRGRRLLLQLRTHRLRLQDGRHGPHGARGPRCRSETRKCYLLKHSWPTHTCVSLPVKVNCPSNFGGETPFTASTYCTS